MREPSVEKRATDRDLFASTHLKTFEGNEEELRKPLGHEHHLEVNFKCGTLDYSSTGYALNTFERWLITTTKNLKDPAKKVIIDQKYICGGWWNNPCRLKEFQTELFIGDEKADFEDHRLCECYTGHWVHEQKCSEPFKGGWYGVHVTQYQKNEGPGMSLENYRFTVNIKDSEGKPIGEHDMVPIASDETGEFECLPRPFLVEAPDLDEDAIWMHYGDQHFTSNDQGHHCNFGKYDGGRREGDCGFTS